MYLPAPSSAATEINWAETEVRVRYADTDQMGVVYYANYLVWFEIGRSELCRQQGLNYGIMERREQKYLAVAAVECRYHSAARYDDLLTIRTRIDRLRKKTISFLYEIVRPEDNTLLASGRTVHVMVDDKGRPVTIPLDFQRHLLQ